MLRNGADIVVLVPADADGNAPPQPPLPAADPAARIAGLPGANSIARVPDVEEALRREATLNAEQLAELRVVLTWLHADGRWQRDPGHNPAPPPLRRFVFGGPGCGKSYFAAALLRHAGPLTIACSPTGVVASALRHGRTLHSVLGMTHAGFTREPNRLAELRAALQGKRIVLLDELSMVSEELLKKTVHRLRDLLDKPDVAFGGLAIVAMGDLLQLPPVGGTPLYRGGDGSLFASFHMVRFNTQVRAASDPQHMAALAQLRQVASPQPCNDVVHQYLLHRVLTHDDLRRDPTWADATFVVSSNEQRHLNNEQLIARFSASHAVPVFKWRQPVDFRGHLLPEAATNVLYNTHGDLWGWFAAGAPAYITHNISPSKGIANGTLVRLHALKIADDNHGDLERVQSARPGGVVELDRPPQAVLVELVQLSPEAVAAWPPAESAVPGRAIIPLVSSDKPKKLKLRGSTRFVLYRPLPYELGFCVTFHKVQGRTCPRVVLDVSALRYSKALNLAAFYVGFSRVRSGRDLRILPFLNEELTRRRLWAMSWPAELVAWFCKVDGQPPPPPVPNAGARKAPAKPAAKKAAAKPAAAPATRVLPERPPAPPPM